MVPKVAGSRPVSHPIDFYLQFFSSGFPYVPRHYHTWSGILFSQISGDYYLHCSMFGVLFNYMVELTMQLDTIFSSLADSTRRDILMRVSKSNLTISELAQPYNITFAGVAKHVAVLEKAGLISKRRRGNEQIVSVSPKAVSLATSYLGEYEKIWQERFNRLEKLLTER